MLVSVACSTEESTKFSSNMNDGKIFHCFSNCQIFSTGHIWIKFRETLLQFSL